MSTLREYSGLVFIHMPYSACICYSSTLVCLLSYPPQVCNINSYIEWSHCWTQPLRHSWHAERSRMQHVFDPLASHGGERYGIVSRAMGIKKNRGTSYD